MKTITISMYGQSGPQIWVFQSDDLATAAYNKIKTALEEWKPFRNDKGEVVTVQGDNGEATVRLEHVSAIALDDTAANHAMQCEFLRYHGEQIGVRKAAEERAKAAAG